MTSQGYEKLRDCEEAPDSLSTDSLPPYPAQQNGVDVLQQSSSSHRLLWTLHTLFLLFNFTGAVIVMVLYSKYSPESELGPYEYLPLQGIVRRETTYFNLTLGIPTEYTMPGSPEVDALWQGITAPPGKVGRVKVGKEDLRRANLTSIPLADSSEYFATLDVFHELHCLDLLRRALSDDPNTEKPQDAHMWKEHRDHCIDSLRLTIQCQSDVSLLSFKWVKDYAKPWPDFRGYHTCRNWDDILDWARDHAPDNDEPHHYIHPQLGPIDGVHVPHQNPVKDGTIEWLGPFT